MPVKQAVRMLIYVLLTCMLTSLLLACDIAPNLGNNTTPTNTNGGNAALNQWSQVAPSLEIRYEHWKSAGPDEDTVTISRFNLQHFQLSVGYQPDHPMSIGE